MNRTKGDEEEYWNSSKFKAFTFDDEDDELSQVGFHEQLLQVTTSPQCHSQIPSPTSSVNWLLTVSPLGSEMFWVISLEKAS